MSHNSRKTNVDQLLINRRQKVVARVVATPSRQLLNECRHCLRALYAGHWFMAFTQFTNAIKTLCTCIVNPKAGANRKN